MGTHDLRRTLATGLGDMAVAEEVIERILNHAARTVVGRHYNHAQYRQQMLRALDAWADRIEAIVEGRAPASNVLPLRASGECVNMGGGILGNFGVKPIHLDVETPGPLSFGHS